MTSLQYISKWNVIQKTLIACASTLLASIELLILSRCWKDENLTLEQHNNRHRQGRQQQRAQQHLYPAVSIEIIIKIIAGSQRRLRWRWNLQDAQLLWLLTTSSLQVYKSFHSHSTRVVMIVCFYLLGVLIFTYDTLCNADTHRTAVWRWKFNASGVCDYHKISSNRMGIRVELKGMRNGWIKATGTSRSTLMVASDAMLSGN